eukprot:Clim_evm16s167 gene=Clim_evmTU16s167
MSSQVDSPRERLLGLDSDENETDRSGLSAYIHQFMAPQSQYGANLRGAILTLRSTFSQFTFERLDRNLVPDVVPSIDHQCAITLHFPAVLEKVLYTGEMVTPAEAYETPQVDLEFDTEASQRRLEGESSDLGEGHRLHTLIAFDPDAALRPPVLHWCVVNIPGSSVPDGTTVVSWHPPIPPARTGAHRYCFFTFRQEEFIQPEQVTKGRFGFKVQAFMARNNLHGPIGGQFFRAKYDGSRACLVKVMEVMGMELMKMSMTNTHLVELF